MRKTDDVFCTANGFVHIDKTIILSSEGEIKNIIFGIIADDHDRLGSGAGISDTEARALADAIYAELGLGWLPYPENKPEEIDKKYIVTRVGLVGAFTDHIKYFNDDDWKIAKVVAYWDISPYQPA